MRLLHFGHGKLQLHPHWCACSVKCLIHSKVSPSSLCPASATMTRSLTCVLFLFAVMHWVEGEVYAAPRFCIGGSALGQLPHHVCIKRCCLFYKPFALCIERPSDSTNCSSRSLLCSCWLPCPAMEWQTVQSMTLSSCELGCLSCRMCVYRS